MSEDTVAPGSNAVVERVRPPRGRPSTARKKLIDAAFRVISRNGLDGTTLAAIIEEAGVGVGSFYNNFSSKEELASLAFTQRVEEFGRHLEMTVRRTEDAALATCFAYRRFVEQCETDKAWASFIVQLEPTMQLYMSLMRKYARVGVTIGLQSEHLRVPDVNVAILAIHSLELAMVKAMLNDEITHEQAHLSAELALRLFGVSEKRAAELARMPMEALRRAVGEGGSR